MLYFDMLRGIPFWLIPVNDDFISPDGDWCRKISATRGKVLDAEPSNSHQQYDILAYAPSELVEWTPRRGQGLLMDAMRVPPNPLFFGKVKINFERD